MPALKETLIPVITTQKLPSAPTFEEIFQERYEALNPEQKIVADTIEGPVLVVAGPGSGKTELLSLRVANILRKTDTPASSILCLTFTDSAAVNMQKRMESLMGLEAYKVAVHTFHSFGREIIAQNPEYFYKGANYLPADEITQLKILQEILETLPYGNILASYHPEQGYTYSKELKARISDLKKSGITPQDFREVLETNKLFLEQAGPLIAEVFEGRVDKNVLEKVAGLAKQLADLKIPASLKKNAAKSLQEKIVESLLLALQEAQNGEKTSTKPITQWKEKFTKKDENKRTILKDQEKLQKSFDLALVYEKYLEKLAEKSLFDYEDMLLDVIKVLEMKSDLRYTLQEKYLYILVDEFQDTNGAQMKLLDLLLDSEVNEGRPNIMAVGDDDQAIYKFQGANIENILGFRGKFRDPKIVVLKRNYRSTQEILDFSRKVILQGENRLETRMPEDIHKDLVASRKNLPAGLLVQKQFDIMTEEFFWIAQTIKKMLEEKVCEAREIALIAPVHRILEEAAKVLNYFGIPVSYERQQNLLEERYIREIITILQYVDSVQRQDQEQQDHLLPEILSFEFWGINRITLWRLAYSANRSRKNWLEAMMSSDSKYLQNIAKFLINLAAEAKEKTAEEIIDLITGVEGSKLPEDEQDDNLDQFVLALDEDEKFVSPFKKHYFDIEHFAEHESKYYEHLRSLQAFVAKIREYNPGKTLYTHDIVEFIQLLKANNLPLNHTLDFSTNENAVHIMTVHKAKGLEFDTVFVLNCQDDTWISRRSDKLSFPSNLPLAPETQTADDALRLFYVALTRAKYRLYLTRHRFDLRGKEQIHLRFLSGVMSGNELGENGLSASGSAENEPIGNEAAAKKKREVVNIEEFKQKFAQEHGAQKFFELYGEIRRHEVYSDDEKLLLQKVLQNYKLSVTHLLNFLNVIDGGPHVFLEQNLLRFPQKMTPNAAFGSAMHDALANFYNEFKIKKFLPSLEFLNKEFEQELLLKRLNKKNFAKLRDKGWSDLGIFYEQQKGLFDPNDKIEQNFASQMVVVNGAQLGGRIDRMHLDGAKKEIVVFDYKTGKAFNSWEPREEYMQVKAWKYRTQLVFYKLLVEHSREYRGKYLVKKCALEFLEPSKNGEIFILDLEVADEEVQRLEKLVGVVYKKIMDLDFPDIRQYDKDLFGIGHFIDDLVQERI